MDENSHKNKNYRREKIHKKTSSGAIFLEGSFSVGQSSGGIFPRGHFSQNRFLYRENILSEGLSVFILT